MDGTSAAMSVASTAGSMVASSVVRWDLNLAEQKDMNWVVPKGHYLVVLMEMMLVE